jgi:hypothetical protein|tara:strand:- start:2502 stop:3317 length:816 start_codon:yes stop_codon:yes gene_type:complete
VCLSSLASHSFRDNYWGSGDDVNGPNWVANDATAALFLSDNALVQKSSMHCRAYRPFYDVSVPLMSHLTGAPWVTKGKTMRDDLLFGNGDLKFDATVNPMSSTGVLFFFKGGINAVRERIIKLDDPSRGIFAANSHPAGSWVGIVEKYDYGTYLSAARFHAAPRGAGLDSYRMAEGMQFGSVPVFYGDGYVPPFAALLNWRKFSISIARKEIETTPDVLAAIPRATWLRMARHSAFVFEEYLATNARIVDSSARVMLRNVREAAKRSGLCG